MMRITLNGLRGFTLIELLVVIAIIGLLSSVVLASLNAARAKGADASVKDAMKQLIVQGQNYIDSGATNFGVSLTLTPAAGSPCTSGVFNDNQFLLIQQNILSNAATGASLKCTTNATGANWAVSISALKGGSSLCIDNNSGWFKAFTTNAGGSCS